MLQTDINSLKVTRRHLTILESSGTFCTQCINLQGVENAKKITVSIISANSLLKITKKKAYSVPDLI